MLQYFETLQDQSGNALSLDGTATVIVTAYPGGGAAAIYSTNGTASPIAGSTVTADATGQVSFFAPDGAYILTYQLNGTTYKIKSPVQMLDPMGFVTATDTGSANTYTVTNSGYPATLYVGLKVEFKAANTNTGASTFNLNSTGAQSVTGVGGAALSPSQLIAGAVYRLEWLGASWQLFSSTGSFSLGPGDIRNYGGVAGIDCTASITAAAAANPQVIFPAGAWVISSTPTVPLGVVLNALPGSSFSGAGAIALGLRDTDFNQWNVVEGSSPVGAFLDMIRINHAYGGSSMQGGRNSFEVQCGLTTTSSPSNTNRNYVGGAFQFNGTANDNGTNPTAAGTSAGAGFGIGAVGILAGTATAWLNISAGEFNVAAQSGTSVYYRSGIQIAELPTSAVQGSIFDGALALSGQSGAIGWQNGILFCNANGQHPVTTTGNLIATQGAKTVANGINLQSYTFTGQSFVATGIAVQGNGSQMDLGLVGSANTYLMDFHTGASAAPNYDSRIVASGGNGSNGNGTLVFNSSALGFFNSGAGGGQSSGWGTPTGGAVTANYPGATATLAQTTPVVAQIVAVLKSLGLFAT